MVSEALHQWRRQYWVHSTEFICAKLLLYFLRQSNQSTKPSTYGRYSHMSISNKRLAGQAAAIYSLVNDGFVLIVAETAVLMLVNLPVCP